MNRSWPLSRSWTRLLRSSSFRSYGFPIILTSCLQVRASKRGVLDERTIALDAVVFISLTRFFVSFVCRAAMLYVDQHQLGFRDVRALLGRVNISVKAKLKSAPPDTPADAEAMVKVWGQEADTCTAASKKQQEQQRQSQLSSYAGALPVSA